MAISKNPDQFQLFDTSGMKGHPGDQSFQNWQNRDDVIWHATPERHMFEPSDEQPVAHFGTKRAAWEAHGPNDTEFHTRRLTNRGVSGTWSDQQANTGEVVFRHNVGAELPEGVMESADMDAANELIGIGWSSDQPPEKDMVDAADEVADALHMGHAVGYTNDSEHAGSTSYIVPRAGSLPSWADDVQASPNRDQHYKDNVARITKNRGTALPGEVVSRPEGAPERYQREAQGQLSLSMALGNPYTNLGSDAANTAAAENDSQWRKYNSALAQHERDHNFALNNKGMWPTYNSEGERIYEYLK